MGHYDSDYQWEADEKERKAKEAALKEFNGRYTKIVSDMNSDEIEAINYFIHWFRELRTGLRIIKNIYNKVK